MMTALADLCIVAQERPSLTQGQKYQKNQIALDASGKEEIYESQGSTTTFLTKIRSHFSYHVQIENELKINKKTYYGI